MNRVEYGPEDIAFELERAHGFSLKLECVAIFHGNRERLVRIAPRLRDSAAKIVQPAIPSVAGAPPSLNHAIVIENAMNPSPSHFAHWTVGENRGVFYRNISLIIEPVRDPATQRFGRKPAFVHRDVERVFIVISASADRAQLFDEGFAVPKLRSHKRSPLMCTSTIRK